MFEDLGLRPIAEIDEMAYFKNDKGEIQYHELCNDCRKKCKQSFRVTHMTCERFKEKNAKK